MFHSLGQTCRPSVSASLKPEKDRMIVNQNG